MTRHDELQVIASPTANCAAALVRHVPTNAKELLTYSDNTRFIEFPTSVKHLYTYMCVKTHPISSMRTPSQMPADTTASSLVVH